jgi:hypothetical protein
VFSIRRLSIFVVMGLAFVLAGSVRGVAQEPRMTEPKWSVGDMWTYSAQVLGQQTKIHTMIVLGVRDADYSIRTIQPDGRYEISSMPRGSTTFGNVGTLSWPLTVGQHWSGSYLEKSTNPPTLIRQEITVDVYELLPVPAGTFGAFRLLLRFCPEVPQGECASIRAWLAPEVKTLIKMEFGPEELWAAARGSTVNLVAYAVAP